MHGNSHRRKKPTDFPNEKQKTKKDFFFRVSDNVDLATRHHSGSSFCVSPQQKSVVTEWDVLNNWHMSTGGGG